MSAVIDLSAQSAIVRRCERRKTDVRTDALRGDSNDGVYYVKRNVDTTEQCGCYS